MKTADKARGKWRGILVSLGVDQKYLNGKHGPCPFCEGRDRFRWDNDKGSGSFFCSQCGAGDGFEMVCRLKGWPFKEAAAKVDEIVGGVKAEPVKDRDNRHDRDRLRDLWASSKPLASGDLAWTYLTGRKSLPAKVPACLRFAPHCRAPDGSSWPALIALVTDPVGQPATIHRTFLGPQGKADMVNPRALMPGPLPDGSAVRLYDPVGTTLGIAEGIETAVRAAKRFRVPVWASLTAGNMVKFEPPQGIENIMVFGDCDHNYTGQASAYALANRLVARRRLKAEVHIPTVLGMDWADIE